MSDVLCWLRRRAILLLVVIVGCGPAEEARFSVFGVVVDHLGNPVPGVVIAIDDLAPAATAGDGSFSVANVSAPYDLIVLSNLGDAAHVFSGLSTPTPRITPRFNASSVSWNNTMVSGTITGDHLPMAPLEYMLVCVEGLTHVVLGCQTLFSGGPNYSLTADWAYSSSVEVRVRALQYLTVEGRHTFASLTAYGEATGTLSAGIPTSLDIKLEAPPSAGYLEIQAFEPPGLPEGNWYGLAGVNTSHTHTFNVWSDADRSGAETPGIPVLPGATYTAMVLWEIAETAASKSFVWQAGLAEGATTTLTIPVPPIAATPADGATGVTHSTPFVVASPPGSLLYEFRSFGSSPAIFVSTMKRSLTIPDLSHLGVAIPPQTLFGWVAVAFPTVTTADQMVSGRGQFMRPYPVSGWEGTPYEEDGAYAFATMRTFTME